MATNWNPKRYKATSSKLDYERGLRDMLQKAEQRRQDASKQAMHWRNLALHLWTQGGPCVDYFAGKCVLCLELEKALEDVD